MSKAKRLLSYLLSIFLVVSLFSTVVVIVLNLTLFSSLNTKKQIATNNYYEEVKKIIVESCQDYVMQSGFDESIMDNVVNSYDVESDVNGLIDYIYDGKEYEINSNVVKENLDKNIKEYIASNEYAVNEETQKGIDTFEDTIKQIYERNIEYSRDTVKQISDGYKKVKKAVTFIMLVCIGITVILGFIVYKLSKPSLGISMLSTGAILIFLKIYSGTTVAINNILLMNRAFSNTLIAIANQIVGMLFVAGIILCIAGIAWIIYAEASRKLVKMQLLDEHSQVIR